MRSTGTASGAGCLQAPAYLPHGATITSMYASLVDDDPSDNIFVTLRRTPNYSLTGSQDMASVSTSGASSDIVTPVDSTVDHPVVDFPNYSYAIQVCLNSTNTKLYSVRIYYTSPLFSDGFECGETWVWSDTAP